MAEPSNPSRRPGLPGRLVIEKDCIDAFEATGRPFLRDVLDMNWDAVLITDGARLCDLSISGMPGELYPNTDGLDAKASYSAILDAWDAWVIEKVWVVYGIAIESTTIRLTAIFTLIETLPRVGGRLVFH